VNVPHIVLVSCGLTMRLPPHRQDEEQAQVPEQDVRAAGPQELRGRQLHRPRAHVPGADRRHQLQLR